MNSTGDFLIENSILKKYTGAGGDVVIPDGITQIEDEAFKNCGTLTSLYIPDGVTAIGREAFKWCRNLADIRLPESLANIGRAAFAECENLTAVIIPDRVNFIDNLTFFKCSRLSEIHLPESLKGIGVWAFLECAALTEITVPKEVVRIFDSAFEGCVMLQKVNILGEDTRFGSRVFHRCKRLQDSSGFVIINNILFDYYGGEEYVAVPDGITEIGDRAFAVNRNLHSVYIPDGVHTICREAFCECQLLSEVRLPDTLTKIGDSAFILCTSLTEIDIPDSVKKIADHAFAKCSALSRIKLSEGITEIDSCTFIDCTVLSDITLPKKLTDIYSDAFLGCECLSHLTLPEGIDSIGSNAFYRCPSLKEITIPESVAYINTDAFSNCGMITIYVKRKPKRKINFFDSHARVVAPDIPISDFPDDKRDSALRGFLIASSLYTDPQIYAAYKAFAMNQRRAILPILFEDDDVAGIEFYAENKKITAMNFEEEYFNPATQAGASNCAVFLLDWRGRNISDEKIEHAAEKALNKSPYNVADMKKLWRYKPLSDGTLELTLCKVIQEEIIIPEKIGRRRVTRLGKKVFSNPEPPRNATFDVLLAARNNLIDFGKILTVFIPKGIISIGEDAFLECKNLKELHIPASVTAIDDSIFGWVRPEAIYAPANSFAQSYARQKSIPFIEE